MTLPLAEDKTFRIQMHLEFPYKKRRKNHFRSSVFCLKMKNDLWTKLISPWMILDSFENKFLDCGGPTRCAQSPLFASIISSPFKVATQPAKKTSAHKVLPQIKPFRSREVWITFSGWAMISLNIKRKSMARIRKIWARHLRRSSITWRTNTHLGNFKLVCLELSTFHVSLQLTHSEEMF